MFKVHKKKPQLWKGLATGLAAGLVAAWTMNQYQAAWKKAAEALEPSRPNKEGGDDATVKTANSIYRSFTDHPLHKRDKKAAGALVHYAFGATMGGLYGVSVEQFPAASALAGTAFGTALFVGADEIMLPALGLAKPPAEFPLSQHLFGLTSHWVYGVTTEVVRRTLRRAF